MSTEGPAGLPGSPQPPGSANDRSGWAMVGAALRPRLSAGQLVLAVLFFVLGFALVTQVRIASGSEALLTARPDDLVRILDTLEERQQRLRQEQAALEATRSELLSGAGQRQASLQQAREQLRTYGVLAGTLPARGPGVVVTIGDPDGDVTAPVLLDTIQELRDAGAEAIQIDDVRVVASTSVVDTPAGIAVDGQPVSAPYEFVVIGDPQTLAAALAIPGGVTETVGNLGGTTTVEQRSQVEVTALKPVSRPQYARPAPSQPTPSG